jgi:hypothetical protein
MPSESKQMLTTFLLIFIIFILTDKLLEFNTHKKIKSLFQRQSKTNLANPPAFGQGSPPDQPCPYDAEDLPWGYIGVASMRTSLTVDHSPPL